MQHINTRRGQTQPVVNKNKSHSRFCRAQHSEIFNACCYTPKEHTLLNKCVEDPRTLRACNRGMTANCMGFILIEVLVVVLIIAVLAAVALPQYQKAVQKSRFASLKPLAKSVKDAQELYYQRYGQYASQAQLGDLDIGIPSNAGIELSDREGHDFVRASHTGLGHNNYVAYLEHSANFAGNIYCEALTGDEQAENLCVAEGGTAGPTDGDYTLYLLSGNSTGEFANETTNFQSPVDIPSCDGCVYRRLCK